MADQATSRVVRSQEELKGSNASDHRVAGDNGYTQSLGVCDPTVGFLFLTGYK